MYSFGFDIFSRFYMIFEMNVIPFFYVYVCAVCIYMDGFAHRCLCARVPEVFVEILLSSLLHPVHRGYCVHWSNSEPVCVANLEGCPGKPVSASQPGIIVGAEYAAFYKGFWEINSVSFLRCNWLNHRTISVALKIEFSSSAL